MNIDLVNSTLPVNFNKHQWPWFVNSSMEADSIISVDSCSFIEGFFHERYFKGVRIAKRKVLNSYNVNFCQTIKLYFSPQFLGIYKSQPIQRPILNLQGKQIDISDISLKILRKLVAFSACIVIVHNFTFSRQSVFYFTHHLNS